MSMPRYLVTGANGRLGQLVIAELARRVGAKAIAAMVRDPAATSFPAGVDVHQGDYDRPETLNLAFAGIDHLLLISSSAVGGRVARHRNVIEAAKRAGVSRIAYTSVLHADTSSLELAEEHRQTEALIAASGIPHTLLRNGWCTENYAASIPAALQHGAFVGSARDGRIASAARADYAEAAAVSLIGDTASRVVHELAGDAAYTLGDFAAELSRQSGKTIPYVDLPEAEYRGALLGAGLPEPLAALYANSDAAAAGGALFDDGRALSRLIGRPTTAFASTIAMALASARPAAPIQASRPEDVLPDDVDRTTFAGVTIRKGTIAAFLQNASARRTETALWSSLKEAADAQRAKPGGEAAPAEQQKSRSQAPVSAPVRTEAERNRAYASIADRTKAEAAREAVQARVASALHETPSDPGFRSQVEATAARQAEVAVESNPRQPMQTSLASSPEIQRLADEQAALNRETVKAEQQKTKQTQTPPKDRPRGQRM